MRILFPAPVAGLVTALALPPPALARHGKTQLEPWASEAAIKRFGTALTLVSNGRLKDASRELKLAEDLVQDSAVIAFQRARVLQEIGDLDGAIVS